MPIQYSVAVRDAQNDALESTTGASAKLQIRSGAQPATCATAASGTLLCEISLPADWMASSSNGVKDKLGTWSGTGAAAGNAGHFRVVNNAGSVCHMQGSVTATGGGGDMVLDNISIASGQTVTVSTFQITRANA